MPIARLTKSEIEFQLARNAFVDALYGEPARGYDYSPWVKIQFFEDYLNALWELREAKAGQALKP